MSLGRHSLSLVAGERARLAALVERYATGEPFEEPPPRKRDLTLWSLLLTMFLLVVGTIALANLMG